MSEHYKFCNFHSWIWSNIIFRHPFIGCRKIILYDRYRHREQLFTTVLMSLTIILTLKHKWNISRKLLFFRSQKILNAYNECIINSNKVIYYLLKFKTFAKLCKYYLLVTIETEFPFSFALLATGILNFVHTYFQT